MAYALWDVESRNLVGDYETELKALTIIENAFKLYGLDSILPLALEAEDEAGDIILLAEGEGLIALVKERKTVAHWV